MGLFESRVPQNLMVSNFVLPLKQQFWGILSILALNFRTDLFINEQFLFQAKKHVMIPCHCPTLSMGYDSLRRDNGRILTEKRYIRTYYT
jgi:hypothetical protein